MKSTKTFKHNWNRNYAVNKKKKEDAFEMINVRISSTEMMNLCNSKPFGKR